MRKRKRCKVKASFTYNENYLKNDKFSKDVWNCEQKNEDSIIILKGLAIFCCCWTWSFKAWKVFATTTPNILLKLFLNILAMLWHYSCTKMQRKVSCKIAANETISFFVSILLIFLINTVLIQCKSVKYISHSGPAQNLKKSMPKKTREIK